MTQNPSEPTRILKALASPVRRAILARLKPGELPVSAIGADLGVAPATLSEHLGALRAAGLVTLRKDRAFRFYSLTPGAMERWAGALGAEPATAQETDGNGAHSVSVVAATVGLSQREAFEALTDPVVFAGWSGLRTSLREGLLVAVGDDGSGLRANLALLAAPALVVMNLSRADAPETAARAELIIAPRGAHAAALRLTQWGQDAADADDRAGLWRALLARFAAEAPHALRSVRRRIA
jgi:DNA-binding transcriptional ArsR family regulator